MNQAIPYNETFLIACALLALLLPLLSFILSLITSERYAWLISMNAPLLMLVSTVFSLILLFSFWNEAPYVLKIEWFSLGSAEIHADIILTNESVLMIAVVSLVSFLVHVYSIGYMAGDLSVKKYFAMLGFFTFSMQGIVLADNLLLLFIFWELVGFSSYMLIGHWNERPAAARAASKAFIMNRVGDIVLLIGLMIVWTNTGSLNISDALMHGSRADWQTAASLCIFCGVIGKSAQFPLFTWLPDAMEGPTPVSALIHAATMVAAGVYLMVRIFPLFTEVSLQVVSTIGLITAVLAALAALYHNDIKRILAYSTISHLGIMMIAVGVAAPAAALLHLFTHAFFKACLFLSAGSVIHAVGHAQLRANVEFDAQDIRNLGGLRKSLPVTYYCFLISGASLAGVPLLSGFLSKDAILASVLGADGDHWILLIGLLATFFLSALYTFRLVAFVFWGEARLTAHLNIIKSPMVMRASIAILAFLSMWFVVNWNPFNYSGWIIGLEAAQHSMIASVISIVILALALVVGYRLFLKPKNQSFTIFENNYYVDWFYNKTIVRGTHIFSDMVNVIDRRVIDKLLHGLAYAQVTTAHVTGWVDRVIVDGVVNGIGGMARMTGSLTRSFQGGNIQLYIFWSIFAIVIFIIWTIN